MKNENIENKIQELSTDYIYNQSKGCFLLLLMSYGESMSEKSKKIPFEVHRDILEIRDKITNAVLKLDTDLNLDTEQRSKFTDIYIELSKQVIPIYKSILSYINAFSIPFTLISDEFLIRKYNHDFPSKNMIDFHKIYNDCQNFIDSAKSPLEKKLAMCQLLKCIPLKMTKDRFYRLLEKGLFDAISEESEENIKTALETFKSSCAPLIAENYGKYFLELFEIINDSYNVNPTDLDDNELENLFEDYKNTMDILIDISDYIKDLYNDINSLIVIFFSGFSFDNIIQYELPYKDLYYTICDIISNKNNIIYLESTNKLIEKHFEHIIDKLNELTKKELQFLNNKNINPDNFSLNLKKILFSEDFIRTVYYSNIDDYVYNMKHIENEVKSSYEFKEKSIKEFINTMKPYYETLKPKQRKASMLTLLSSLPIYMTTEEFISHIQISIDACSSIGAKALIVDKIGSVLHENGFEILDEEDSCDCKHEHHHNCNCEHDH